MRYVVEPSEDGARADRLLAGRLPGRGRQALARAFAGGLVHVNGRRARKGDRVRAGDVVEVPDDPGALPEAAALRPIPEPEAPLWVLHLDEALVALAKPAGVASHPLRAGERGTLANALVARHPECADAGRDPREAGLVQRLDRGTSGVILAARDRAAWQVLRETLHEGRAIKVYLALVAGALAGPVLVDAPLAHAGDHVRVCTVPEDARRRGALPARTRVEPLGAGGGLTLVRAVAETGRMHQVRAHLAHLGHPIVGDARYGAVVGAPGVVGHFLHAARVELPHPRTGHVLVVEAPLPDDRLGALAAVGIDPPRTP